METPLETFHGTTVPKRNLVVWQNYKVTLHKNT
jgi:hypothetical protein